MSQQAQTDVFLKHYGVKGMKWGVRKAVIKDARANTGKHERKLAAAEQDYLKARASGKKKQTEKALENLNKTYKDREANRLTAGTMTRGEQIAYGVLTSVIFTPVVGAAAIGANAAVTRESQKIGDYPLKVLQNAAPDED